MILFKVRASIFFGVLLLSLSMVSAVDCLFTDSSLCSTLSGNPVAHYGGSADNAHLAPVSFSDFTGRVCCFDMGAGSNPMTYLSAADGSGHVSNDSLQWATPTTISVSGQNCQVVPQGTCADVCVFEIDDPTNGHVASCNSAGSTFAYEMCCEPAITSVPTPTASFDVVSTLPHYVGDVIEFDGSASVPGAGAIFSSYVWQVDGVDVQSGAGSPSTFTHTFASVNDFSITLSVTNNYSQSDFDIKTVQVFAVPGTPEDCTNSMDDDGDGFADCQDADCYAPYTTIDCGASLNVSPPTDPNGPYPLYNANWHCSDGGGFYSPAESRCCLVGQYWDGVACADPPEDCGNAADDDGDGRKDVADGDCLLPSGYTSSELEFVNCVGTDLDEATCVADGLRNETCRVFDAGPDQLTYRYCSIATDGPNATTWGVSAENGTRVVWNAGASQYEFELIPELCDDGIDNDHDGLKDCADPECQVTIGMSLTDPEADGPYSCGPGGAAFEGAGYHCSHELGVPPHANICCLNNYEATWNASTSLWSCQYAGSGEACNDGIDNDGDSLIDCADDDCHNFNLPSNPDAPYYNSAIHSCEASPQDSDYCNIGSINPPIPPSPTAGECEFSDGTPYYCSYGEDPVDPVGNNAYVCCQAGEVATFVEGGFGIPDHWECAPSQPCYNFPGAICDYEYSDYYSNSELFYNWSTDTGCLTPGNLAAIPAPEPSLACCLVADYGGYDYYSNSGNVRVI